MVRAERVFRADELGPNRVAVADDAMNFAAGLFPLALRPGRVVGEHPLRAAEVRNAHRRQQDAAQLLRWEGNGDANDAAENAVFTQDVPEGFALTEQPHVCLAEGNLVFPKAEHAPGRPDLHRAELRLVGVKVRREEVIDVVLARVDAGLERRPGHRRDRRQRGAERFKATLFAQRGHVRQLAFG